MSNSHTPTAEQQAIFDAAEAGHDVVATAGAGAGKTSTLVGLAQRLGPGLIVTFNKDIKLDIEPKLKGTQTTVKTSHALAYAWMMKPAQRGLKRRFSPKPNVSYKEVRTFIGAREFKFNHEHSLTAFQVSRAAQDAHGKYCDSADEKLTKQHVRKTLPPVPEGVDPQPLIDHIFELATRYSNDAMSENGTMWFGFAEMLKRYQLSKPVLAISWLGFDEAQDTNPVTYDIVARQTCQKIIVGDANQQIYEWRGAVNAMGIFAQMENVKVLGLTQSFRFGQAVADMANLFLTALDSRVNDEPFRLRGFEKIESKVQSIEAPDAVLARSNAGCLTEAIQALEEGRKVAIVGGGKDIKAFAFGARELQLDPKPNGKGTDYRELQAFNNWEEVLEYVESGEADATFKRMVKIISDFGVSRILAILGQLVEESEADVVISTAHKAKGREWNKVRIAGDFKPPEEEQEASKSELRLAYVAVTRAKLELDLGGLGWIQNYVSQELAA